MSPALAAGRILIIGRKGQLGSAFTKLLGAAAFAVDHEELDLRLPSAVIHQKLDEWSPSVIINAAAYTQVDLAETERDACWAVNAVAPATLAEWCRTRDCPLVHFSTDYVFSGENTRPWREEDIAAPVNYYGQSKLAGERGIAQVGGRYLIFRTSWLYSTVGKNFFLTMLRLGQEREVIRVVADQKGTPTYVPHFVQASWLALDKALAGLNFPSSIYHLTHTGETTWYDFASAIFDLMGPHVTLKVKAVEAIFSRDYPAPAQRPHFSQMDCGKAKTVLGVELPDWRKGLAACVEEYNENHPT